MAAVLYEIENRDDAEILPEEGGSAGRRAGRNYPKYASKIITLFCKRNISKRLEMVSIMRLMFIYMKGDKKV